VALVVSVCLARAQAPAATKPQAKPKPAQPSQLRPVPTQPQSFAQPFSNDPLTVSADLVDAMRLMNVNPQAALALLHKLNARSPNRDDILTRLAYTLQVVEKTDSAAIYSNRPSR